MVCHEGCLFGGIRNYVCLLLHPPSPLVHLRQDSSSKYLSDLRTLRDSLSVSDAEANLSSFALNDPWNTFKSMIGQWISEYERSFKESRLKSFTPAMEHVGNTENEIHVLIETARDCESTTAKTKCEVEFGTWSIFMSVFYWL